MEWKKRIWGAGLLCAVPLAQGVLAQPAVAQSSNSLLRVSVPNEEVGGPSTQHHSMLVISRAIGDAEATKPVKTASAVQPVAEQPVALQPVAERATPRAQFRPLGYEMAPVSAVRADYKITPVALDAAKSPRIAAAPAETNPPSAEDFARLQQRLESLDFKQVRPLYSGATPGISSHIATAYGGYKGDAALGFMYQNENRGINDDDGGIGGVISFGSPRTVGVDVGLGIYDLGGLFDDRNTSFGRTGSISLKLHRPINRDTAVAIGADDLLRWNPEPAQKPSYYAVVSHQFRLKPGRRERFSRLYATLGVGNGRYRDVDDIIADDDTIGIFGGLALAVNERFDLFTEWTGQDLNVGASFVPFKRVPLIITPALADLTHQAGGSTRFTLGVAYRLKY